MLNPGFPFVTPTIPGTNVPMFPPMMDMSSTQALLQIVRTSQFDAFMSGRTAGGGGGGGTKRPCSASSSSSSSNPQMQLLYPPHGSGAAAAAAAAEQNPLDLSSSSVPCKKPRKGGFWDATTAAGSFAETFLNMPAAFGLQALHKSRDRVGLTNGAGGGVKRLDSTSPKPATKTAKQLQQSAACQAAPNRVLPCASSCAAVAPSSDKNAAAACPNSADKSTVAAWTVDDVCDFVSSIDLCAEYSQVSTRVII